MPKPTTAKKHEKKPKVAYALAYVIIFSYLCPGFLIITEANSKIRELWNRVNLTAQSKSSLC